MSEVIEQKAASTDMAKLVYVLYLLGFITGITALVGVIMAYVYKDDAPDWLKAHYQFQIRTFWIGLLYVVIGSMLALVVIGFLILAFWAIWLIIRCVKGFQYLEKREPIPDPTTWLF